MPAAQAGGFDLTGARRLFVGRAVKEKRMTLIEERQRRIVTTHAGSLPRPQ